MNLKTNYLKRRYKKKYKREFDWIQKYLKLTSGEMPSTRLMGRVMDYSHDTAGRRMKEFNNLFNNKDE
jgi:hypothetical protein